MDLRTFRRMHALGEIMTTDLSYDAVRMLLEDAMVEIYRLCEEIDRLNGRVEGLNTEVENLQTVGVPETQEILRLLSRQGVYHLLETGVLNPVATKPFRFRLTDVQRLADERARSETSAT